MKPQKVSKRIDRPADRRRLVCIVDRTRKTTTTGYRLEGTDDRRRRAYPPVSPTRISDDDGKA